MAVGSYPLHSRLDLASGPSAVRWARIHARDVFQEWTVPSVVADDALLVVSELVTNAVRHAGTSSATVALKGQRHPSSCTLALRRVPDHLLIFVYDQDRRPPVLLEPSDDAEGGRGLRLVDELSAEWGYAYPHDTVGKAVWAKFITRDAMDRPTPGPTHCEQPNSQSTPQWSARSARIRAFARRAMAGV
jgi:anti-sigma regulatory factor (Ser/Thr protein kinase)